MAAPGLALSLVGATRGLKAGLKLTTSAAQELTVVPRLTQAVLKLAASTPGLKAVIRLTASPLELKAGLVINLTAGASRGLKTGLKLTASAQELKAGLRPTTSALELTP